MIVSPRETRVVGHFWRGLVCASLFFATSLGPVALAQEPRFFRIGTAATGGSFFEVGGLVASAISSPADGPACGRGGSCGVRGLVAVAQATPGSIENLRQINSGQIESGFAQADLAGWAYNGSNLFAEAGPLRKLRAIASMFPEAAHLVVRADSPIRSLADLAGKSVAVGEMGSGSAADAAVVFAAARFGENDVNRKYLRPGPATEQLRSGSLDAMLTVPSSSTSMATPVCSMIARIILPPGPMTSRMRSGLMRSVKMRGACGDRSSRGPASVSAILPRMCNRPSRA